MGVKKTVEDTDFYMYIGPSIRGVIQTATIYEGPKDRVLDFLAPAIAKYPRIKSFVISGTDLQFERLKLKKPGTFLFNEYKTFVNELKKEGGIYHAY